MQILRNWKWTKKMKMWWRQYLAQSQVSKIPSPPPPYRPPNPPVHK